MLPENTPSSIMNVFGRELNHVLPQERITEVRGRLTNGTPMTADRDELRAYLALDWFIRAWVARWSLLVPGGGEELASALAGLPPIRDSEAAEAAGNLIEVLAVIPENTERFVADNYKTENFFDQAAVKAARGASAEAVAATAGTAVVDGAASVILDACMAARTDVALKGVSALAMSNSLDFVWPYIENWANGPGDFDAKRISIGNLAPMAARKALDPTIEALQQEVCGLYAELYRAG